MERTFLMIKPDGVQRGLIGEIIKRFEMRGIKIVAMKMIHVSKELAEKHYEEHIGKKFYEKLVNYITMGPSVAMVIEGKNVIEMVREMVGKTDPQAAKTGTIRGDFAQEIGRNIVHASDSKNSAKREISLFFNNDDFVEYEKVDEKWLFEGK